MAPINIGLAIKQSKDVSQLPCGIAFAGFYPPLLCMQEPQPHDTIRTRELDSSDNVTTITSSNLTAWLTKIQEAVHDRRTWIAFVLGLLALLSIMSLCYQCCKGLMKKRRRRAGAIAARRRNGEEQIDLSPTPRSDFFMQFTQRKEVGAAEQRAQRQREQVTRASDGMQTPGGVIEQTELHDLGSIHIDS